MTKAFISGCTGLSLSDKEKAFFKRENPWGLILFARNVGTPDQVRALTEAFRSAVGRADAPVLIDQEGGRVARLKPPHWLRMPAGRLYGELCSQDPEKGLRAAYLAGWLICNEVRALGISVDCIPCLDVAFPGTSDVIGDRSFSDDPEMVATLGRAMADGALRAGVLPVIKHMPGHGRALVDSHLDLPFVEAGLRELEQCDLIPFSALNDLPLGMTAHIVFSGIDSQRPATQSTHVVSTVIRQMIGFDGCLMSDDISMKALGGDMETRAARTIDAGCDLVLHCNGDMTEMQAVAAGVPELTGRSEQRCTAALACLAKETPKLDRGTVLAEFRDLTGWAG